MSEIIDIAAAFLGLFAFLLSGGYAVGWCVRLFVDVAGIDD